MELNADLDALASQHGCLVLGACVDDYPGREHKALTELVLHSRASAALLDRFIDRTFDEPCSQGHMKCVRFRAHFDEVIVALAGSAELNDQQSLRLAAHPMFEVREALAGRLQPSDVIARALAEEFPEVEERAARRRSGEARAQSRELYMAQRSPRRVRADDLIIRWRKWCFDRHPSPENLARSMPWYDIDRRRARQQTD